MAAIAKGKIADNTSSTANLPRSGQSLKLRRIFICHRRNRSLPLSFLKSTIVTKEAPGTPTLRQYALTAGRPLQAMHRAGDGLGDGERGDVVGVQQPAQHIQPDPAG